MDRAWITLCTLAGSFAVALLSLLLGYRLFVQGARGDFRFSPAIETEGVGFESIAPGIILIVFGMLLATWTVHRALAK